MNRINWREIRDEYIAGKTTYRKLAQKHGVSYYALCKRAQREGWYAVKASVAGKEGAKAKEEKAPVCEADRASNLLRLTDEITVKVEKAIAQLEVDCVKGEKVDTGVVDTQKLRQIIQSMKDIRELADIGAAACASKGGQEELIEAIKEAVESK